MFSQQLNLILYFLFISSIFFNLVHNSLYQKKHLVYPHHTKGITQLFYLFYPLRTFFCFFHSLIWLNTYLVPLTYFISYLLRYGFPQSNSSVGKKTLLFFQGWLSCRQKTRSAVCTAGFHNDALLVISEEILGLSLSY